MIFTSLLMQASLHAQASAHIVRHGTSLFRTMVINFFPQNLGLDFSCPFAGPLPVCECAIVPVMTRLTKKGWHRHCHHLLLSAPIINRLSSSQRFTIPGQRRLRCWRLVRT
jgi:hypothetical protein